MAIEAHTYVSVVRNEKQLRLQFLDIKVGDVVLLGSDRYFVGTILKPFGELVHKEVFRYFGNWYIKRSFRAANLLMPNAPFGALNPDETLEFVPSVLVGNLEFNKF